MGQFPTGLAVIHLGVKLHTKFGSHCSGEEACHTGEFRCLKSYFCIPERRVRDGWEDCPDGSDERYEAFVLRAGTSRVCQENEHRCRCGFPRCIGAEKVSDGVRDCLDGSDEGTQERERFPYLVLERIAQTPEGAS
ncbi:low-density lipoprotein receptor, putative [Ixodes scapularis]|uniref:Low-density lipoprotein receptor, putative n=1 Tax=Ixodes scapularis TaxID=6945 RepID=B7Q2H7_IXOSC|nr:low-density lipoprotein receptor, putative [Ixodes scapularis]|eukprot:XP_002410823.1 low-density lipoprotein receptor, putative [Ixodes scapularis]